MLIINAASSGIIAAAASCRRKRIRQRTLLEVNAMWMEATMTLQVTSIMIGVQHLALSKKLYGEGLGCKIEDGYPNFASLKPGG